MRRTLLPSLGEKFFYSRFVLPKLQERRKCVVGGRFYSIKLRSTQLYRWCATLSVCWKIEIDKNAMQFYFFYENIINKIMKYH